MDKVANSKNDEFYTPAYAVRPILKYIPKGATVWCPFDTENSWFVKLLQARGNRAIYSHKDNGDDFFQCTSVISIKTYLAECDYIVSNPPYSLKTEVLKRLFDIEKPFAMLVGV
ncbi:MAG: sugar-phospahte nucleotidyltransferase, partial [Bacteroidetes bacterium]|nr:sugar-phospahte nucleotidyltransferase [Bacteroidota bacterium]